MAERRMFAKTIIDSDAFLEMPQSTQLLYFHLSMRADDDGFINKPKTVMRMVCCKEDDMRILIGKKFIIPFESGVVVIKHWKIHNYIRNDRYNETKYCEEKSTLEFDENGAYKLMDGIPLVNQMDTQVRLGKDRLGKVSKGKEIKEPIIYFPTDEKLNQAFKDFIEMRKSLKNGAMTERAITMMITKLSKLDNDLAISLLEKSTTNNWKDIYMPEVKQDFKQVLKEWGND